MIVEIHFMIKTIWSSFNYFRAQLDDHVRGGVAVTKMLGKQSWKVAGVPVDSLSPIQFLKICLPFGKDHHPSIKVVKVLIACFGLNLLLLFSSIDFLALRQNQINNFNFSNESHST